jgi:hypothetical protein
LIEAARADKVPLQQVKLQWTNTDELREEANSLLCEWHDDNTNLDDAKEWGRIQ